MVMVNERRRLFRWTDLFAVIGVLLIAGWTPGYMAQSEEARDVVEEGGFVVPPARIGDRVVYGLVVQWQNEEPVLVAPLLEVAFRAPTLDESPYDAWIVEERTWFEHHLDLGFGRYERHASVSRTFYDETGDRAWVESERSWGSSPDDHRTVSVMRPSEAINEPAIQTGLKVRASEVIPRYLEYKLESLFGATVEHRPSRFVTYVVDTPIGPLYGTTRSAPSERIFGSLPYDLYNEMGHPDTIHVDIHRHGRATITLDEPFRSHVVVREWTLYHPEIPVRAGIHKELYGSGDRPAVTMDIIPVEVSHGTGRGLIPAVYEHERDSRPDPPPPADDVELVTLGDVHRDTSPILRGIDLARLWSTLEEQDTPESLRGFARNAHLAGFTYSETGIREGETGDPLNIPNRPVSETFRSDWLLLLARGEDVRVAHLNVTDSWTEGVLSVVINDGCDDLERAEGSWEIIVTCSVPDPGLLDKDRRVASPHEILGRIHQMDPRSTGDQNCWSGGTGTGDAPCSFAWFPVVVCSKERWCQDGPIAIDHGLFHAETDPPPAEGYAMWWTGTKDPSSMETQTLNTGRYDLGNALPIHIQEGPFRMPTTETAPTQPAASASPVIYEPLPLTHLATGGAFLVLVSLLVRTGSWLFGGGAGPMAATLYARVTKQGALTNERREAIIQALTADPGLTVTLLSARLGTTRTPTLHHLETLRRTGHVAAVQNGRRRHWFVCEGSTETERLARALAKDPVASRFLAVIHQTPGRTLKEVADDARLSKYTASRTGGRLERLGLVEKKRQGRLVRFYPKEADAGHSPGAFTPPTMTL